MLHRIFVRLICLAVFAIVLAAFSLWWQPDALFAILSRLSPEVLWNVKTDKRVVALSLDDGPSELTGDILRELGKYGARATFFVLGKHLERHVGDLATWPATNSSVGKDVKCQDNLTAPDIPLRRVVERLRALGHEVGHHTWTDRRTLSVPEPELDKEFDRLDGILYPCGSENGSHRWFRPGHGVFNRKLLDFLSRHGYRAVLGSVHPFDPQIQNAELNAWHVINRARPGAIIILHDGRLWTLQTLRIVLPELKRQGFEITTIGELVRRYG